jgi:rhodanese-related sulfurtransferase
MMDAHEFAVVIDVRTQDEWDSGNIANATHIEGLHTMDSMPDALVGCENCRIAVYCRSGVRAGLAAQKLKDWNFNDVFNGLGVNQFTDAGYSLVNTESTMPMCSQEGTVGTCGTPMSSQYTALICSAPTYMSNHMVWINEFGLTNSSDIIQVMRDS